MKLKLKKIKKTALILGKVTTLVLTLLLIGNFISFINDKVYIVATDQAVERVGNPIKGSIYYEQYCVGCHQADGTGMNGMLAADLTDEKRMSKSNEELLISIRDGYVGKVGQMPPWKGTLSEKQMKDILQYIRDSF